MRAASVVILCGFAAAAWIVLKPGPQLPPLCSAPDWSETRAPAHAPSPEPEQFGRTHVPGWVFTGATGRGGDQLIVLVPLDRHGDLPWVLFFSFRVPDWWPSWLPLVAQFGE